MAAPAGVNEGAAPVSPGLVPTEPVTAEPGAAAAAAGPTVVAAVTAAAGPVTAAAEPVTAAAEPVTAAAEPAAAAGAAGPTVVAAQAAEPAAAVAAAEQVAAEYAFQAGQGRRRSVLGTAGLVLGVIALAGVAVGGLAVVTHGFHRKTVVTYRQAAVFSLRPGECVNFGPNGLAVTALSCATPHDAEVFASFTLPASSWPGGAVIQRDASSGCASRLGGYLNPQLADAGLDQEYFYPDQASWQAGARTVVCAVRAPTGQLTGSVRSGS